MFPLLVVVVVARESRNPSWFRRSRLSPSEDQPGLNRIEHHPRHSRIVHLEDPTPFGVRTDHNRVYEAVVMNWGMEEAVMGQNPFCETAAIMNDDQECQGKQLRHESTQMDRFLRCRPMITWAKYRKRRMELLCL